VEPKPEENPIETSRKNLRRNRMSLTSYKGMAGYQGWFTAEGDGAERGWHHYEKSGKFEPGMNTIDFFSEYTKTTKQLLNLPMEVMLLFTVRMMPKALTCILNG
jgi:hypothetical protein